MCIIIRLYVALSKKNEIKKKNEYCCWVSLDNGARIKLGYIWVLTGRSAVWVRITECTILVEQKSKQTAIDDKP